MSKPMNDCWMLLMTMTDGPGQLYYFYDNHYAALKHKRHLEKSFKENPGIFHSTRICLERMSGFIRSEFPPKYEEYDDRWDIGIDALEFGVRTSNCLANLNIRCVGDLVRWKGHELLRQKNFGDKCLKEVEEILEEQGLKLGTRSDT